MIGKGKSIAHTGNAINYAVEKHKAEILDKHNLIGSTGEEIEQEFKMCQNLNGRCENNTFSFVLSPSIEDGKKLTDSQLRNISKEFLEKMNLKDNQAIILKHQDKAHTHLHIYANRIGFDGKATKDHYIGKQCQDKAHEIAKSRNLTCAKDVEALRLENTKDVRQEISRRMDAVLKNHKPRNFEDFKNLCKGSGVELEPSINKKNGATRGYKVKFDGQTFKASDLGKKKITSKVKGKMVAKTIAKFTIPQLSIVFKAASVLQIDKGFGKGLTF